VLAKAQELQLTEVIFGGPCVLVELGYDGEH
jgi:hypothetical protein